MNVRFFGIYVVVTRGGGSKWKRVLVYKRLVIEIRLGTSTARHGLVDELGLLGAGYIHERHHTRVHIRHIAVLHIVDAQIHGGTQDVFGFRLGFVHHHVHTHPSTHFRFT